MTNNNNNNNAANRADCPQLANYLWVNLTQTQRIGKEWITFVMWANFQNFF